MILLQQKNDIYSASYEKRGRRVIWAGRIRKHFVCTARCSLSGLHLAVLCGLHPLEVIGPEPLQFLLREDVDHADGGEVDVHLDMTMSAGFVVVVDLDALDDGVDNGGDKFPDHGTLFPQ